MSVEVQNGQQFLLVITGLKIMLTRRYGPDSGSIQAKGISFTRPWDQQSDAAEGSKMQFESQCCMNTQYVAF